MNNPVTDTLDAVLPRPWWKRLLAAVAVLVVIAATLSALFEVVERRVPGYRDDIEQAVAEAFGHPVRIGNLALGWRGLFPVLSLDDVEVQLPTAPLRAGRLRLGFSPLRLIRGDVMPHRLDIADLELTVRRDEAGRYHAVGLDAASGATPAGDSARESLEKLKRVSLRHIRLRLELPGVPASAHVFDLDSLDLSRSGSSALLQLELALPEALGRSLRLRTRVSPQAFGWRADIERLDLEGVFGPWETAQGTVTYAADTGGAEWSVRLNYAQLDDAAAWARLLAPQRWPSSLLSAGGVLRDLDANLRTDGVGYAIRGRFEDLSVRTPALAFDGFDGALSLSPDSGQLRLNTGASHLELPEMLVGAAPFEELVANLQWKREADAGWRINAPFLRWKLLGSEGRAKARLTLPEDGARSPQLDLEADFSVLEAARLKALMPRHWSEDLRQWLQRGIVRAGVPKARLVLKGVLDQFPYDAKGAEGEWALDLDVANATLAYAPGWPAASGLAAQLAFRGNGLRIRATQGQLSGVRLQSAEADIRDFNQGVLEIRGRAQGELDRYYGFLASSPLKPRFAGLLESTKAAGPAGVDLRLRIPLERTGDTRVSGTVSLQSSVLGFPGFDRAFTDLKGAIVFDEDGRLRAPMLEGRLWGEPLSARILPRAGGGLITAQADVRLEPAAVLLQGLPAAVRSRLGGRARVRGQLQIESGVAAAVVLESDLTDVRVDLPPPLDKSVAQAAPLKVVLSDRQGLRVQADWRERLGADLQWGAGAQPVAAQLRLGGGEARAPEKGLSVRGSAPVLDIELWRRWLRDAGFERGGGLAFNSADVRAGRWLWNGYVLPDTRVLFQPLTGGWRIRLEGSGAAGELDYRTASGGQLKARLTGLTVLRSPGEGSGVAGSTAVLDPGQWPVLDLDVSRLDIGNAAFGRLTAQTVRVPDGQRLQTLRTYGAENDVTASGQWLRRNARSSAHADLRMTSTDFAGLLQAGGFGRSLEARATRLSAGVTWAPAANGLDWQQARGNLSLEFESGQLRTLEPGAGRVLGLLNFYALPRRLDFNFRDVVSRGLGFDTFRGTFDLGGGHARTDDLEVDGPSLRMKVRGRIGLAARDYDQQVTVYPGLSSGVTLGAAVLGGPIAGVIALLAQQVLNEPFDKATQLTYRMTGSWDNPQVNLVAAGAPP